MLERETLYRRVTREGVDVRESADDVAEYDTTSPERSQSVTPDLGKGTGGALFIFTRAVLTERVNGVTLVVGPERPPQVEILTTDS